MGELLELDSRCSGEIEVTLYWQPDSNRLLVQVVDWLRDEGFSVDVRAEAALDAFHHPYAYGLADR
jgi:hypothetical protein